MFFSQQYFFSGNIHFIYLSKDTSKTQQSIVPMGQPQPFVTLFMFFTASLVNRDQKYSQIENVILPALRSLIDLWASYFVEGQKQIINGFSQLEMSLVPPVHVIPPNFIKYTRDLNFTCIFSVNLYLSSGSLRSSLFPVSSSIRRDIYHIINIVCYLALNILKNT